MTPKKLLLVIPELISARVFLSCGIVRRLAERLGDRLIVLFTTPQFDSGKWTRDAGLKLLMESDVIPAAPQGFVSRAWSYLDTRLDREIGFFPLALRFNLRNQLHLQRMAPGHKNGFLDLSRKGRLPDWGWIYRLMFAWIYNPTRYVPPELRAFLAENVGAMATSNLQYPTMPPYLVAARRLGIPIMGNIASWDHPVGKGVVYPKCVRYLVQNEIMRDALQRYHGIAPSRVSVTGWPQSDVFASPRPRRRYEDILKGYGLDPSRPCVLITGNTETNAPYEHLFLQRLVEWWRGSGACDRFSMIFRPHPKSPNWETRFATLKGIPGFHLQAPSYTDMDVLAALLQHVSCVVTNAGTILLDSLVNDRPVVCVLYDEGAPPGVTFAAFNVIGEHYKELMDSGAFYLADHFEQVVANIERCLADPGELDERRRAVCREIMGEVDGRAADRVVDAICGIL